MNLYQTIGELTCVKFLGSGYYGDVFLYQQNKTNNIYAVKMIDKSRAKHSKSYKYLVSELQILKKLNHPNIAQLIKVIDNETQAHLLLVMEYCNGGSLSECLKKYEEKYNMPFTEEIVQYLTKQIVNALVYIHGNNIIHRDLKSENIMAHFKNEEDKINLNMMKAEIKIIDFGLSKIILSSKGFATSLVGTPLYEDPKILEMNFKLNKDIKNFQYSKEADIWSLGCICFEMIKGSKVFETEPSYELVKKLKEGNYNLPQTSSREFISFLHGMLQYDGKLRLTARQLLDKSFLRKKPIEFNYLILDYNYKKPEKCLTLKNSITNNDEKNNESFLKNFKRHISHEVKNPYQINNISNQPNKMQYQNVQNTFNSNNNLSKLIQSSNINNSYSKYNKKMSSDIGSTKMTSFTSNLNGMSLPHSTSVSYYQNPLSNSYQPNNLNANNNSNNNFSQTNNNYPPIHRYNSQQIEKKKDDDDCIVF